MMLPCRESWLGVVQSCTDSLVQQIEKVKIVLKEAAALRASRDNAAQESATSLVAEIMGNSDQPPLPGPAAAPPAQPPSQAALSAPGQPSSSSVEQEAAPATT